MAKLQLMSCKKIWHTYARMRYMYIYSVSSIYAKHCYILFLHVVAIVCTEYDHPAEILHETLCSCTLTNDTFTQANVTCPSNNEPWSAVVSVRVQYASDDGLVTASDLISMMQTWLLDLQWKSWYLILKFFFM